MTIDTARVDPYLNTDERARYVLKLRRGRKTWRGIATACGIVWGCYWKGVGPQDIGYELCVAAARRLGMTEAEFEGRETPG